MALFEMFYPDDYVDSTYVIDFEKLYEKGYRGIIFDIDIPWYLMGLRPMTGRRSFLPD